MDIREKLASLIHFFSGGSDYAAAYLADKLIANGVTIQQWIPVSERLPETNAKAPDWSQTVLFRTAEGYIHSGYRNRYECR